ncbi:hypothetical protein L596_011820 [Steinernema carpocapsae]|uniref:Transmembrane protein n=1 Tax=Steinernema carpocapsae TaxID=34508 RepID=A0A4U5NVV3_STECR|nr:hypothetical protein L596_011820 [Steinernema carpocapsae]
MPQLSVDVFEVLSEDGALLASVLTMILGFASVVAVVSGCSKKKKKKKGKGKKKKKYPKKPDSNVSGTGSENGDGEGGDDDEEEHTNLKSDGHGNPLANGGGPKPPAAGGMAGTHDPNYQDFQNNFSYIPWPASAATRSERTRPLPEPLRRNPRLPLQEESSAPMTPIIRPSPAWVKTALEPIRRQAEEEAQVLVVVLRLPLLEELLARMILIIRPWLQLEATASELTRRAAVVQALPRPQQLVVLWALTTLTTRPWPASEPTASELTRRAAVAQELLSLAAQESLERTTLTTKRLLESALTALARTRRLEAVQAEEVLRLLPTRTPRPAPTTPIIKPWLG